MELVEGRMKQSKRLMVILTPTPEPEVADRSPALAQTEALTEFDWQVRFLKTDFVVIFSSHDLPDCRGSEIGPRIGPKILQLKSF